MVAITIIIIIIIMIIVRVSYFISMDLVIVIGRHRCNLHKTSVFRGRMCDVMEISHTWVWNGGVPWGMEGVYVIGIGNSYVGRVC